MNDLDKIKNIYIDPVETVEEAKELLEKGIFYKQNRIEEVFYEKFVKLRKKIHKVIGNELDDPLDYDTYVMSILVDCRAIFLENKRYKFNSTLQSTYRARGLNEYATGIDDFFEKKIIDSNITLKEAIKSWVDKRVVHYDYMDLDTEDTFFKDILKITNRDIIGNLFHDVLIIAQQYEEIRKLYGKNTEEQINSVLKAMTG